MVLPGSGDSGLSLMMTSSLRSLVSDKIDIVNFPLVSLDDIRGNSQSSVSVARLADWVRDIKKKHRLDALLVDTSETAAIDATRKIGVHEYLFFNSSLATLCNCLSVPLETPGFIRQRGTDVPHPFQNPNTERFRGAKGILVNSFFDLEPGPARALKAPGLPPVYAVGPLSLTGGVVDEECRRWLDKQPPGSVLFVSFGPCAQQYRDQINEVASALEKSRQMFLWVVGESDDFLSPDFRDSVKNVAYILHSSAPQTQLLVHKSICGFLTDCEWSAVMESIAHGVPLIALPLSSEQKMNAEILTKVSVRPNADENGLVGWNAIAAAIEVLKEGEDGRMVRDQMHMLKDSAARALTEEGSSYKALAHVANQWKSKEHSLFDLLLFFVAFYVVSNLILSVRNSIIRPTA